MSRLTRADAEDILFREARYLDTRDWDKWLDLYRPDATFWVPAWRDEITPTSDPERELSLIYYRSRRRLEERVWRIRSGQSVASTPLPRTAHAVTNILPGGLREKGAQVYATFTVHRNDVRSEITHIFFGHYEYILVDEGDVWRIQSKKIHLLNDNIPTVLDIYCV